MPTLNDKKKKFKFPSSTLMLFSIIVIIAILTYIVPAGQYAYVDQGGTQVVDGSSFQYVEQNPVNPFRVFVAIQEGFLNGAQIIFLILFGYFWVYSVMQTGAFTAMINRLLGSKARDSKLFIPIVMLVFSLAGSTYGEFETVYGLIPIFVALAIALGYDALVGMCMSGVAVAVGFASATTNPFTIGIAQTFGDLPMFSGLGYRWVIFGVFYLVSMALVMRYAMKVKKDPTKSLVYGEDYSAFKVDCKTQAFDARYGCNGHNHRIRLTETWLVHKRDERRVHHLGNLIIRYRRKKTGRHCHRSHNIHIGNDRSNGSGWPFENHTGHHAERRYYRYRYPRNELNDAGTAYMGNWRDDAGSSEHLELLHSFGQRSGRSHYADYDTAGRLDGAEQTDCRPGISVRRRILQSSVAYRRLCHHVRNC